MPQQYAVRQDVLDALISVGNDETSIHLPATRSTLQGQDRLSRNGSDTWEAICLGLPLKDQIALFRGLVITERELDWPHCSVTPTIFVFRYLQQNLSDEESDILLDWALKNTSNPHTPSGQWRGARSIPELDLEERHWVHHSQSSRENGTDEGRAIALRREQKKANAEGHRRATEARRIYRMEVLDTLSSKSGVERLAWIISDKSLPIYALPPSLAPSHDSVETLTQSERKTLLERLRKVRGRWGDLKRELENA